MIDAIVSFFLTVIFLFGLIFCYNAVFFSRARQSRYAVILVSGRAKNAEQILRAAALAGVLLHGRPDTVVYDCGTETETRYIIEKLSEELGLVLLPSLPGM